METGEEGEASATEASVVVNGVDYGVRLPPGRHGIPHQLVEANQRERLLDAATSLFAELGYGSLSVARITDRAHVSRATFYEMFADKLDCLIAAQRAAYQPFTEAIVDACEAERSWPEAIAAAVRAALRFGADSPDELGMLLLSSHPIAEPALAGRALAVHEQLAKLLRRGRRRHMPDVDLPELTEPAVVGAAIAIAGSRLAAGEAHRLPEMAPELVQMILGPYLGGAEAARVALAVPQ
jgi:AcrR family transcriptional regulator